MVGIIASDIPKIAAQPAPIMSPRISITYHSGNLYRTTVAPTDNKIDTILLVDGETDVTERSA
jgi:hypothetical protein